MEKEPEQTQPPLFTDVSSDAWYCSAVEYVAKTGLLRGNSETTFRPDASMTRSMLATVLYRLDGERKENVDDSFGDVERGAWYTDAVAWAAAEGVVNGYSSDSFGPNDPITREQLVVMLWRYAGSPSSPGRLEAFSDADLAGDWAREALRWAVEKGILRGKGGGILDPKGQATRAEVAAMLMRYCQREK